MIRRFLGPWTLVTKSFGLVSLIGIRIEHELIVPVSCCLLRNVAGQGRPFCSPRLLLCKSNHEAV